MHNHILIPVALDHEQLIAGKIAAARHMLAEGGRITLLTVLENVPGYVAEFVTIKPENHLSTRIKAKLDEVAAKEGGVETAVETGKAGVRIASYASENDVDLIVIGSHKPNAQDYFLGSTASRVARRAPCSVYIMR